MIKNIYLIRHGQSEGNAKNIIQGHFDAPLTELGHTQAQYLGEYIYNNPTEYNISHIYCSDLERAHNTAKHIGNKIGHIPTIHPNVREAFFGKWEGKAVDDILAEDRESFLRWRREKIWRPDWCENFFDVQKRGLSALSEIYQNTSGDVAIVSHGGFIYALIAYWLPEARTPIQNCSVTHISIQDNDINSVTVHKISHIVGDMPISPDFLRQYGEMSAN